MLLAALFLNILILVPLITALATTGAGMDAVFGTATDARRILTAVYAAIAIVSAGLIASHVTGHPWAVPMTVALFCVQIVYKLITVPTVGLGSPVVLTNLVVVAVQGLALAGLFLRP